MIGETDPPHRPREEEWPGLIWGFDVMDGQAKPLVRETEPSGFRWLHFTLADQRARRWITDCEQLSPAARELLLSTDEHPRAMIEEGGTIVACVIPDCGRDFVGDQEDLTRAIHFALTGDLMVTARLHPVRCADEIRRRFDTGSAPGNQAAAIDLMIGSSMADLNSRLAQLAQQALQMEDALLDSQLEPDGRTMQRLRRRAVRVRRQASGLHRVLHRLEEDEELPSALLPPVERMAQRIAATEADVLTVIEQERLLREEIDVRATQRTNQNLYLLSVMTALMLPPTLVAGLFGMNTGGLPFTGPGGTVAALVAAALSTAGAYVFLRKIGFFESGGKF